MDKESALEKILDIVDTVYEIIDPDLKRAARAELKYLHSVNREMYLHNHAYMALTPPAAWCNMLSIHPPISQPALTEQQMTIDWIKMEERLPPVDIPVLICDWNKDICVAKLKHKLVVNWLWWEPVGFYGLSASLRREDVEPFNSATHWMSLPPPPVTGASK